MTKASSFDFEPGDKLLLLGGAVFQGALLLDWLDSGTSDEPIILSTYGPAARARIESGASSAINAYNAQGLRISNLHLVGAGADANTQPGLSFYADLPGNVKLQSLEIDSVEIEGYGKSGLSVGSWNGDTGYDGIRLTRILAHHNKSGGIFIWGLDHPERQEYPHLNVYIGSSVAHDNWGDPAATVNSGSGIVLSAARGGLIENSVAHSNGKVGWGGVGIWTYDATGIIIQKNESYGNRTAGAVDGGGFDLDGGVSHSVLQYNYSHDNDGAGLAYLQYPGARPLHHNVIRYNISENDGHRNSSGAISIYSPGPREIHDVEVYNNTVYVTPSVHGTPSALKFYSAIESGRFHNNIFVTTGGIPLIVDAGGHGSIHFQNNAYWAGGDAFNLSWSGTTYSSLASWRAGSGQESLTGVPTGFQLDPQLTSPGNGGVWNDPARLPEITAYQLKAGSPAIDGGLELSTVGIASGGRDFFGNRAPSGAKPDIGCHER